MKHSKILLTGGSGNLGRAILKSGLFPGALSPGHIEMDIADEKSVDEFFKKNNPDAVVHCAAIARMTEVENDPARAVSVNIAGTCNLVKATFAAEGRSGVKIRFVYISTDGVYPGAAGNYSESDATIPYNKYGWTKLGGECAVRTLPNFCIIRTSFFDPRNISFDSAATDMYSSKIPIDELAGSIQMILDSVFSGVINVGGERKSFYDRYNTVKPSIKPTTFKDVKKGAVFNIARDASLDISAWKSLKQQLEHDKN